MGSYQWPGAPMEHQVEAAKRAWSRPAFALFHEMGTGKTYTALNIAQARYQHNQIDRLLVICPTGIKSVWESEVTQWVKESDVCVVHSSQYKSVSDWIYRESSSLKIMIVGVEALSQGRGPALARNFLDASTIGAMAVVDESSRLKNPTSVRTRQAIALGFKCSYRMILTGTPITQGIHDLYGQFTFLDPTIINCKSWVLFRNRYCIMGGFESRNIVGYQNTEELMGRIRPYVHIVKKEDVLDLPPKVYERIGVTPTKQQLELIRQLKDTQEAEHSGEVLTAATMLERITRFQQIIGGHFPFNIDDVCSSKTYGIKPIDGKNPKLEALMESIEELDEKAQVIIWARYVPEIELIRDCLISAWGDVVSTFYGALSYEERVENVEKFRRGSNRFMVSNQAVGGMGQTWVEASYVYYYSNSFSYEDRVQSEDRAHRKGQTKSVTYIDIEADHHYDRMILKAIGIKGGLARYVEQEIRNSESQRKAG